MSGTRKDDQAAILDSGVEKAQGGGGNCIGDDMVQATLLNASVVTGAGGGGNCIGDDLQQVQP